MKRISFVLLFSLYMLSYTVFSNAGSLSSENNEISAEGKIVVDVNRGFADMAKDLIPAVVSIATEQKVTVVKNHSRLPKSPFSPFLEEFREFFEGIDPYENEKFYQENREVGSLGSGFIIDKSGIIVTNYHVIKNSKKITVTLDDGTQAKATILGRDVRTDLAVLKINLDKELPYVRFGNSNDVRVGDWVVAIGNPFGIGVSVSAGVVSARFRDIASNSELGLVNDFIQTDAAINKGNSGGPLFNAHGEVIGINTAIFSPSGDNVGIGFAIPSNNANAIIKVLMSGKKVEHGWLGITMQPMTSEMYSSLNLKENYGILVVSVVKGSPADKAGIKPGDVIIKVNDEKVRRLQKLLQVVLSLRPRDSIKLTIYNNGKLSNVSVTLGKLEDDSKDDILSEDEQLSSEFYSNIGFNVKDLTDELKKNYYSKHNIKSGVLVTNIDKDSDAFKKGVREKDLILQVNQHEVKNVKQFTDRINKEKSEGKTHVLLLIKRLSEVSPIFISVKLK